MNGWSGPFNSRQVAGGPSEATVSSPSWRPGSADAFVPCPEVGHARPRTSHRGRRKNRVRPPHYANPYPKAVSKKYRLKSGCRLDEATGQFVDTRTGQTVAREQAVEVYNPSDRTYYDLQGRALRTEQSPTQVEYATEYYLDRHTGEVKNVRRPVRQSYVVKKGVRFDKKTGQFTDAATGNAVAAQDAVVQIRQ